MRDSDSDHAGPHQRLTLAACCDLRNAAARRLADDIPGLLIRRIFRDYADSRRKRRRGTTLRLQRASKRLREGRGARCLQTSGFVRAIYVIVVTAVPIAIPMCYGQSRRSDDQLTHNPLQSEEGME